MKLTRCLFILIVCLVSTTPILADEPVYSPGGVALGGYDVVAYFIDRQPAQGDPAFSYRWGGVDWHFSSQTNRELFIRSPESYQPMFGGFCGLGAAHGALVPSDPTAWSMHDGQLVLNQNHEVTETWRYNPDINIQRAQAAYANAVQRYRQWQNQRQGEQQ